MRSYNKIWIDFSDLIHWKQTFTGTQRVTYEIGLRYHQKFQNSSFFSYDQKAKQFYEISFQKLKESIEKNKIQTQTDGLGELKEFRLKSTILRIYHSFAPYFVKKRLTPKRKVFIKNTLRRIRGTRLPFSNSSYSINDFRKSNRPIKFSKNDAVVILGKPWDFDSFSESLRKSKIENEFQLIHLIYDMIPVFLPHVFGKPLPEKYTRYMFEAISLSDQLIAISESTKRDIEVFCEEENLSIPKISVIRLGDRFIDDTHIKALEDLDGEEFILCVGTLEIRKNHILLYTALRECLRMKTNLPKIVLVGALGWYTNDVLYEFKHDPLIKDLVLIKSGISDSELAWLYRNCKFTIYPSVYEGWGLPVAEALSYGKVCLTSSSSSMPEIGGNLVDYFSPYDSGELAQLIKKYLDKSVLRQNETTIKKQYKNTTWDQTFAQFVDILELK